MKLKVTIKKRTQNEYIILFMLLMSILSMALIEFLGVPTFIKYMIDVAWFFLFVTILIKCVRRVCPKSLKLWITVFFVYTLVIYIFRYQSIIYYLWGLRNNFRFYVFFFACSLFLKEKDFEEYLKWFDVLFYVNAVVMIYQYFILALDRDHLGGIFGTKVGCNGFVNIFFVIVVTKSLLYYLHKKENIYSSMIKCVVALVLAAFAEVKIFYVEFVLIIFLLMLLTGFTLRKLIVSVVAAGGLVMGITVLVYLFPEFRETMTMQGMVEMATSEKGYTSSGDFNRLTALTMTKERLLTTAGDRVFGLGLGNCDYSDSYRFLTTDFYNTYKNLHYVWFSTSFVLLEMGIVGLTFFGGFFVLVFLEAYRKKKYCPSARIYCQMAQVLSVLCVLIAIYNVSLRMEAAYMMYFLLAFPFVGDEKIKIRLKQDESGGEYDT